MEKLRSIIGLPVLETETGVQIGEITDVMVDMKATFICGFIITGNNWLTPDAMIDFVDVVSLGRDAMMVGNQHVRHQLDTQVMQQTTYYLRNLFDKEIFTDSGQRLGVLVDILFDHVTGEMRWYQVSDSIITDLLYGRMMMPLPQNQRIGPDKVIVPDGMAELLNTKTEDVESQ